MELFKFALLAFLTRLSSCHRNPYELTDELTDPLRYDKRSRPPGLSFHGDLHEDPVLVTANVYIYVIGGLDTQTMEFTSQLMIRYSWYDPRLAWSPTATGVTTLDGEAWLAERIWTPTIFVVNEKHSSKLTMPKDNVHVALSADGLVSYQYRMNLGIYCAMEVEKFPFDYQTCTLRLESWSLPTSQLLLHWDSDEKGPVFVDTEFPLLEYRLTQTKASFAFHQRHDGNFSQLDVELTLAREAGHYVLDFYVPAMLLVTLSWVSFWLDPAAAPGRVTIGTSTLLTFITLTRNVGTSIPKVSYIKAVDIYSMMCTAFIFCSLLEFAFVNSVWRRRRNIEVKKLDTRNVLKSTLTPNTSRRNSGINQQKSFSALDIRQSSNQFYAGRASQNGLSVNSLDFNMDRKSLGTSSSLVNLSSSIEPATPSPILGDSFNNRLEMNDRCHSLSIPVPDFQSKNGSCNIDMTALETGLVDKEKQSMNPQEIAKWIDRRSRIVFPVVFLLANALYWSFIWL